MRERCRLLSRKVTTSEAVKKRQWRRTIERSAGQRIPIGTRYSICVRRPLECGHSHGGAALGQSRRRERWQDRYERGRHGWSGLITNAVTSLITVTRDKMTTMIVSKNQLHHSETAEHLPVFQGSHTVMSMAGSSPSCCRFLQPLLCKCS